MRAKSDVHVVPALWRVTLAGLAALVIGGAGLALLLAGGFADPPRAPVLTRVLDSPNALPTTQENGWELLTLVEDALPPFTLEAEAIFLNPSSGEWGLWLDAGDTRLRLLVRPDGYYRTPFLAPDSVPDRWIEFMHLTPARNRAVLHVAGGEVVLRLNDEIAERAPYDADLLARLGVVLKGDSALLWQYVRLYTSE